MTIEFRGRVLPLAGPAVTSLVVADGKIVHVGDPVHGMSRTVIDLEGATLLPAFVDSHCHPLALGMRLRALPIADPAVTSLEGLLAAVTRRHRELPPGAWLTGQGYDEAKWPEHRVPTRTELDAAAPGRPVVLTRSCAHHAVASTAAFEAAGLWHDTLHVPGIDRDPSGAPTGGLHEMAALSTMNRKIPAPDQGELLRACEAASHTLAGAGIVHASDLCAGLEAYDEWEVYDEARRQGRLTIGIDVFVEATPARIRGLPAALARHPGRRPPESTHGSGPEVFLAGVKCLADGSVSGSTAALYEPFWSTGDRGLFTTNRETLLWARDLCVREGLQLAVHAMGDRAVDFVLDSLPGPAMRLSGGQPALTLEHASLPSPKAIREIASRGIGISTQPVFPYVEIESYLANLGPARTRTSYPLRSLLAAGAELALSSDAPSTASADPADPWPGIAMAARRVASQGFALDPEERLGLLEALTLYSAGGNDLRGLGRGGRVAPGYRADLAIWARDPFEAGPEALVGTKALATIRDGTFIHGSDTFVRT